MEDKMETIYEKWKNKFTAIEGAGVDYKASVVFLTLVMKQKKKRWDWIRCAMCIQIGRDVHTVGELSREDIPSSLVSRTNMGLKYVPFSDTRRFLRSIALSMLRPFEVLHCEDEALTLRQVEGVGGRAVTPYTHVLS